MLSLTQRSETLSNLHNHNISPGTREIFLHGYIGDSWEDVEVDHRMANGFLKNMTLLEGDNHNPILIHQCTCGGDWPYGMAIYDRIKASPCYVTVLAHAHARSMSSIIPLAADFGVMMPSAVYMIHHGTTELSGEVQTVISNAEQTKIETKQMLALYVEACRGSERFSDWSDKRIHNYLMKKLESDWYLTARESVQYGFMNAVLGDSGAESIGKLKHGYEQPV